MSLQNSSDNVLAIQPFIPANLGTVSVSNDPSHDILVALSPAGTITSMTLNFPSLPFSGQKVFVNSTQIITTMTLSTSVPGALSGFAGVGGFMAFIYDGSSWRRIG